MIERPILFSGEMVKAILEGKKTQTRRVVKTLLMPTAPGTDYCFHETKDGQWEIGYDYLDGTGQFLRYIKCPYGQPGDRLWVRETCRAEGNGVRYFVDQIYQDKRNVDFEVWSKLYGYHNSRGIYVPSIHMPRWASRLTLEIVNIRVERVQDISTLDALEEGLSGDFLGYKSASEQELRSMAKTQICGKFSALWDSINAKRGYSWESNPWVWVIEFKKVEEK